MTPEERAAKAKTEWRKRNPGYHSEWQKKNPDYNKRRRSNEPEYVAYRERCARRLAWAKLFPLVVRGLKAFPCTDCGVQYPHYVMDFDHREPEKKVAPISRFKSSTPMETLVAEIEKCDLVCANCHRERTHGRARSDD